MGWKREYFSDPLITGWFHNFIIIICYVWTHNLFFLFPLEFDMVAKIIINSHFCFLCIFIIISTYLADRKGQFSWDIAIFSGYIALHGPFIG